MSWKIALASGLIALASVPTTLAAGTPAPAPATAAARQCFWSHQINGFRAVDDRVVNLRVGVNDFYRLEMLGACPNLDMNESIGVQSRGPMICTGLDATVVSPSQIGPQRCPVRSVRKLTPQEAASLPKDQRP